MMWHLLYCNCWHVVLAIKYSAAVTVAAATVTDDATTTVRATVTAAIVATAALAPAIEPTVGTIAAALLQLLLCSYFYCYY